MTKWSRWTQEEDDKLLNLFGTVKMEALSKELGRSMCRCRRRYYELTGTTSVSFATGYFKPPELAEIVGVSRRTVNHWISNNGLGYSLVINKHVLVSSTDFWKWISNGNENKINYGKYQEGYLIPEPKWVKDRVSNARKQMLKKGEWSIGEIKVLKFMYDNGSSNNEVAIRLNRGVGSVKNKKAEIYSKAN